MPKHFSCVLIIVLLLGGRLLGLATPSAPAGIDAPDYASVLGSEHMLHWERMPLRLVFLPSSVWTTTAQDTRQAVLSGFAEWSDATHGVICTQVVTDPAQADVMVLLDTQAFVPGRGAAVGYTNIDFTDLTLEKATINLALGDITPSKLQTVAAHEFGHALGIDGHSDNPHDLMYPVPVHLKLVKGTPKPIPPRPVTERDFNTLKLCCPDLFASAPAASRIFSR